MKRYLHECSWDSGHPTSLTDARNRTVKFPFFLSLSHSLIQLSFCLSLSPRRLSPYAYMQEPLLGLITGDKELSYQIPYQVYNLLIKYCTFFLDSLTFCVSIWPQASTNLESSFPLKGAMPHCVTK